MEGFFPQDAFRVVFFRLDQRPFFREEHVESSSFFRESRLFLHRSTNFSIRFYKPVALFSVIFCNNLKYQNFRLIASSRFKLIAFFLNRLMDNFNYFLFSDI